MGQCLMIVKPDAMQAGNVGKILKLVEEMGYVLHKAKTVDLTLEQAKELYAEYVWKDFFDRDVEFVTSDTVLVLIFNHPQMTQEKSIKELRSIAGKTDPTEASPGTIRFKYGTKLPRNAVHVSDSVESFERELKILFGE
jgi:nucleoside-diphosphate kinase